MKLAAAAQFCHRMSVGLHAGADLIMLLNSEASHGSGPQRRAMRMLSQGASNGEQLYTIMKREQPFFPPLMIAMTRIGEETGRLERSLKSLANHYEHLKQTRREFLSSITFQVLQLFGAILVVSLLILVMGMLTPPGGGEMADLLGFGLRGPTGVLWFWFYISIVVGLVLATIWAFARNVAGIQNIVPLIYMIPKLGDAIQTITISRFCWSMALALDSGLDPIRSIRLALDSTDSEYYQSCAADAEAAIRGGSTLAGAIEATGVFPPTFIERVEIAEVSGTDAESMNHLAAEYDQRAKSAVKMLSMVATVLIRTTVIVFILYVMFRIGKSIFAPYNEAFEPIMPRRK